MASWSLMGPDYISQSIVLLSLFKFYGDYLVLAFSQKVKSGTQTINLSKLSLT